MVARVRAGDDSALGQLYDQYAALVFGIARRLLGDDHAADVTQEVFVTFWERPDRFDPDRGSLRTFFAVTARRRSIDLLRSLTRASAREGRAGRDVPGSVPNVDEAAMALIASERVRIAVQQLPPEQRRAVELAYFDGLTYREVAVATGVAEGTAKSRLRLALVRLASHLHDEGVMEIV